jgi:class 3 adenylate cyclase
VLAARAVFGVSAGGPMAILFAATYPARMASPTGIVAGFDGPARAVRAAAAVIGQLQWADVAARAGVHSGECESRGQTVDGLAVSIAREVALLAQRGEVVVSQTVRDLVIGSSIEFEDRGPRPVNGAPDDFQVFSAVRT